MSLIGDNGLWIKRSNLRALPNDKFLSGAEAGKETIILYFGDLDPSGWEMLPSMMTTLQDEMGLGDLVGGYRYALTADQVEEYSLPRSLDAIKPGDTLAKKYMQRFGDLAVELDALPPATLEHLVAEAIKANIDMDKFSVEQIQESEERVRLAHLGDQVRDFIERAGPLGT